MTFPIEPYKEERPWGNFERFTQNASSTVKIITVKTGEAFSLQSHKNRDEFWRIISGKGMVRLNEETLPVELAKEYQVPRGTKHRVEAGSEDVVFLEISTGQFDEDDIERFEDKYGR